MIVTVFFASADAVMSASVKVDKRYLRGCIEQEAVCRFAVKQKSDVNETVVRRNFIGNLPVSPMKNILFPI